MSMTNMKAPPASEIDTRLKLACEAADKTRRVTLPAFTKGIASETKSDTHYDPVTLADQAAEDCLRAAIIEAFPQDGILGEEREARTSASPWQWIIDPIDGTRGFLAGVPVWSTLIGITYHGKPVIGLMDFPAMNTRYIGAHGKSYVETGSEKADLKTRACKDIRDSVISCTEPFSMFSQGQRAAFEMIRRTAKFTRLGLDAFGYALIASGRIDLVLEAQLQPYDIAAIVPVIEGAGGILTDWNGGNAVNIGRDGQGGSVIAVGDPALAKEIYPYLARVLD